MLVVPNFINVKLLDIKKMKIILNNISKTLMLGFFMMFAFACEDPDEKPILTFDDAIKGSYPRVTAEVGTALVNPNDLASVSFGYSVEFVDETKGADVTEYKFTMIYDGGAEVPMPGRTYGPSDFTTNSDGFASMTIDPFTATELAGLAGETITAANVGKSFTVKSYLTKGGLVFGSGNASSTITGPAFAGRFDQSFPIACPSEMFVGEVSYVGDYSMGWGGGASGVAGTTSIVDNGGGNFDFADWSFGSYLAGYGCCTPGGTFGFTDLCGQVTFETAVTDGYGDSWDLYFNFSADKTVLTILSDNYTYNSSYEKQSAVITFPTAQTWECTNCIELADFPS
jgi:hypothetical protein